MEINRVVIIGGGTAGWLAANHIGSELHNQHDISITLIESPDIPPIGVGEGTVPDIRNTLARFGISESALIKECDATFKQSIKFVNWMDRTRYGDGNFFHHLFDVPNPNDIKPLTQEFLHKRSSSKTYAEYLSSQHNICELGLAPKDITMPEYTGELAYAYHLNAGKFADLLARNAVEKYGVKHLKANVTDVHLGEDGSISSLTTDKYANLKFDFYVDCSGFESLLMSQALKVPFVDVSNTLLIDSALVVQVPTDIEDAIPPYTIATAHQAGWIWDIALSNRRGVGFVYSSKYMSDGEAETKLDRYLGGNKKGLMYRKIPMPVGYREKFWHKNCVALGLAQGFLEPLEATSILLTDFSAKFLVQRFPKNTEQLRSLEQRFNHAMQYSWKRTIDFIKLHYSLSDRTDSDFWLANKNLDDACGTLKERLALWQDYIPAKDDFFSQFEVFYLENFLFVLYGMDYNTQIGDMSSELKTENKARLQRRKEIDKYLSQKLPVHRDILDKIKKYGMQSI